MLAILQVSAENELLSMGLATALVIVGAFFNCAGTALLNARRSQLREEAEEGKGSAKRALSLLDSPTLYVASAQAAALLCWTGAAATAAAGLGLPLAMRFSDSSFAFVKGHPLLLGVGASSLAAIVLIAAAEAISRAIAFHAATSVILFCAGPLAWAAWALRPLMTIVIFPTNLLLKPMGAQARYGAQVLTEEELKMLVEAGKEEGVIEEDEREMIDSILEFTDTVVRQVMVPRIDMSAIDATSTVEDVVDQILECGHSRIPVYEDNVDSIVGIVHAKDLLRVLHSEGGSNIQLTQVMRPAFFVPENKRVSELLTEFRTNKLQLAVVRDEYGGTAGLVTVEDLIEEIVGEIRDEYDEDEPQITAIDDGIFLVDARLNIDDLNEELDAGLPEGDFETVGGFVFGLLGKEPAVGDKVDYNGWIFTVEAKEDNRLRTIRIETRQPDSDLDIDASSAI